MDKTSILPLFVEQETEDIEKFEKEKANIETKLDKTTNELQKITDETTETTSKISIREKAKAKVRELDSKIACFKDRTERLLDLIEKNKNKFSKLPIGPLGLLLTLKDKSWGYATECLLGESLYTFVVDNLKDLDLLKNLAYTLKMATPNIILTKFSTKLYEYKPIKGFNAFIDNILIDKPYLSKYVKWDERLVEPTVMNVLIKFHNIESVIYLENRKEAFQTLRENDRLHEAWSKDGSKLVKQRLSIITTTNNRKGKLWVESFEEIKKIENETREINEEIENIKNE